MVHNYGHFLQSCNTCVARINQNGIVYLLSTQIREIFFPYTTQNAFNITIKRKCPQEGQIRTKIQFILYIR